MRRMIRTWRCADCGHDNLTEGYCGQCPGKTNREITYVPLDDMQVEHRDDAPGAPRGYGYRQIRRVTDWITLNPEGREIPE